MAYQANTSVGRGNGAINIRRVTPTHCKNSGETLKANSPKTSIVSMNYAGKISSAGARSNLIATQTFILNWPTNEKPTLSEIADRIDEYLNAKKRRKSRSQLVSVSAWSSGRWVYIQYERYKAISHLSRTEAEKYLAWLDAGNVGKHFGMSK